VHCGGGPSDLDDVYDLDEFDEFLDFLDGVDDFLDEQHGVDDFFVVIDILIVIDDEHEFLDNDDRGLVRRRTGCLWGPNNWRSWTRRTGPC
jgi:hypothetical protein